MEKIKIIKDSVGETLTIWLGRPEDEHICKEIGGGVVLIKDQDEKVIGLECLHCSSDLKGLSFEAQVVG